MAGVVYVEYLLCFMPIFLIFLAVTQLALLHIGQLVVQHAAALGVRVAIVVLDDDPAHYGGEPRNCLLPDEAHEAEDSSPLQSAGDAAAEEMIGSQFDRLLSGSQQKARGRLATIRDAVYFPLSSLAPAWRAVLGNGSVHTALQGSLIERWAGGVFYNRAAAALSFPSKAGSAAAEHSSESRHRFAPREDITLRVAYLFRCGVPLVSQLLCHRVSDAELAEVGLDQVESPRLQRLLRMNGSTFRVLQAEDTLPNQGADYAYPSSTDDQWRCDDRR